MISGDQIEIGSIDGEGIAIGHGARVEINRYTEIIVRPDSFEDVPPAPGEQPYKGLTYFTETDADIFFGREELSDQIVTRLRKVNFLAVIGASGSGKSSLLRAGIVPRLRKQNWRIQIMTPTARPLQQLVNMLNEEYSPLAAADELQVELATNPRALHLAANRLVGRANATQMLLVVDQFEELFTQCRDEIERKAFVDNLLAATGEDGTLTILIGLRADFYGQTAQYEGLRSLVSQQQEFIGPMRQEDLVRIIAKPAKRGGWQFVEGLVEQILEDTADEPGYLPLLSHALLETWELRRGTVMTLGGYRASGGVEGAIARTAEDTLLNLDEEQIPVIKHIFLSLTALGEGAEDTRRIASSQELHSIVADEALIDEVVEELVQARLITVDDDQIQVAHEALIRRWPRLCSWIDEDRERLSFFRRLTRAAQEWENTGCQKDYLFHGSQLEQVETRIEEYKTWELSSQQALFIDTSVKVAKQENEEEEKRKEIARQDARRSAILTIAGGSIGLGFSGMLVNLAMPDLSGFFALLYVAGAFLIGAFVGFFYVPFFDSIVSDVRPRNEILSWPAGILAGVIAFVLAALMLFYFYYLSEFLPAVLLAGSAWGGVAGAGRLWIQHSERPKSMTVPLVVVFSGVILVLVYAALQQLGVAKLPFTWWLLFIIGLLVPLAILLTEIGAQYTGRRKDR